MRSTPPFLVAALGCLAVGGFLLVMHDQPEPADPSKTAELPHDLAGPAISRGFPDALTRLQIDSEKVLTVREFARLFESHVGESIVLPLGHGLPGRVNMLHRHPTGDLALGINLDGKEEVTVFLSLNPEGKIGGQIISRSSPSAYSLTTNLEDGTVTVQHLRAEDLVCARFEEGILKPGLPPDPESAEGEEGGMSGPEEIVPLLESRPGSNRVIYLNFEGETVTGTPWNSSYNDGDPIVAAPYGTPANIQGIWESISEDYAVFDVNVTTDRSAFENAATDSRIMVIFSPTKAWYGTAGGVAYVDSFGSATNPYCWVFNLTLNGAAESGGHEIGHTVGLRHDGTSTRAYYTGHTHASGVSWGAIMGTSYNRSIVQFSKGEYPNANRTDDDFAIISTHLDPLPDDHGETTGTATVLPGEGTLDVSGVVENEDDADLFRIETDETGTISLTATPRLLYRNLDIRMELLDENLGLLLTASPAGPFDAPLTAPAQPAGTYFIRISGSGLGDLATGYGEYGSVGSYTLTGTYPASPLPNIPTGLSATDGTSTDEVTIAWSASALADGYRVYRGTTGNSNDAVLLASPSGNGHSDLTAVPGTVYHYFVSAFNTGGESPRSAGETGFRQLLPPASPTSVTATDDSPHSIRVSWPAADRAQSYRVHRNTTNQFAGAIAMATITSTSWHDTTTTPGAAFHYFVEAINAGGDSAPAGTLAPGEKIALPPDTPSALSATDGTSPNHTLVSWTAASLATGYQVFRNTTESTVGAEMLALVGSGTTHLDTSGEAGTVYWYFVRSSLPAGESGPSNLETGFRLAVAPSAPIPVTATQGTHPTGILVSWPATSGALRYFVYRTSDTLPENAELIAETTALEWLDETIAAGRSYRYFVRAGNTTGLSDYSEIALGYGSTADPTDDLHENNDDLATPTTLDPLGAADGGSLEAIAVDGDPDWYAFTLEPGDQRIDLAMPYDPTKGSALLSLLDESGQPVASSTDANGSRVLTHTGPAGASYLILIERDDGAAVPYELLWSSLGTADHGLTPDAVIGAGFPPSVGEGILNTNGSGQSLYVFQRGETSRRAFVDVVNRSAVAGLFTTRGGSGSRHFDVECYWLTGGSWQRVTATMRRTGVSTALDPFARAHFQVLVRAPAGTTNQRRASLSSPVSSRVSVDASSVDLVGLRIIRPGGKPR